MLVNVIDVHVIESLQAAQNDRKFDINQSMS